jgi:hypothetical protein
MPWGGSGCTNNTGLTLGFAMEGLKMDTHMVMWPMTKPDDELHPAFKEGTFMVRKTEFHNFFEGGDCSNNTAIQSNEENSDNRPVWQFKQINKKNVSPGSLLKFYDS